MMWALLLLLGLMALAALALVLLPLGETVADPDAAERATLEKKKAQLLAKLRALDNQEDGDKVPLGSQRERHRLEVQAAMTMRALDTLPAAPPPPEGLRTTAKRARWGWGLALGAVLIAALSIIPMWQKGGLGAAEAQLVTAAQKLPHLQTAAASQQTPAAYNAWGDAAFELSDYPQAMQAYTQSLKADPRQPKPLRRLGTMLLNREQMGGPALEPDEAGNAFMLIRTAAQLAPDEAESQLLLGYALVKFGKQDLALEALERYRELNPQGRDADELITSLRTLDEKGDVALNLYAANCASCHGPAGGGGLGPSLRASRLGEEAIRQIIQRGRGAMPAYPDFQPEELDALVTLMQTWQTEGGAQ